MPASIPASTRQTILSRGYTNEDITSFLAAHPGDEGRLLSAFSEQQGASSTPSAPQSTSQPSPGGAGGAIGAGGAGGVGTSLSGILSVTGGAQGLVPAMLGGEEAGAGVAGLADAGPGILRPLLGSRRPPFEGTPIIGRRAY